MEQERTKQEIIDDLYGLRAGLSLISVEYDKIVRVAESHKKEIDFDHILGEKEISNDVIKDLRLAYKRELEDSEYHLRDLEKTVNREKQAEERKKDFLENEGICNMKEFARKVASAKTKNKMINFFMTVCHILAFVFGFAVLPAALFSLKGDPLVARVVLPVAIVGIVLPIILSLILSKQEDKTFKNLSDLKDKEQIIGYKSVIPLHTWIEHADKARKKFSLLKKNQNIFLNVVESQSAIIKPIYDKLKEKYSPVLNPLDWENLDLVIYYFETGRADTVRDALIQVDRQRQTDQIVSAINEASERIHRTIISGFQSLEATVVKCASILSSQLSAIQTSQQQIASDISVIKAFQAKADVSSNILMAQVDSIHNYIKNREIRERNGG